MSDQQTYVLDVGSKASIRSLALYVLGPVLIVQYVSTPPVP